MMRNCIAVAVAVALAGVAWTVSRPGEMPFQKHAIDLGASETCAVADINGDRRPDIVSGENWYEAPKWTKHPFRQLNYSNQYIDNFSDLPIDVDGDGHIDIVSCSYFSRRLVWMRNPGRGAGEWKETVIDSGASGEFVFLVDLDNDGRARELLPQWGQATAPLAWYEIKDGAFTKHVVSPKSWGHGIGAGDVNGDGRNDILTPKGWFEAPSDPRRGDWIWHGDYDVDSVGFLYVADVNSDGRNDIVTSMAHNYGVFWLERGEGATWTKRVIDDSWSQSHAMTLVDLNGDGRQDLVTGKRYMAHNGRDPGEREPLGIYWYEWTGDAKKMEWVKHVVDYGSRTGAGMQIPVTDIDGDGDLDFAVGGKSGVFLFENLTKRR
ncbi:MAG: FG-GAP repeat domain-containing protein [Bryobacteraceae bacterium]